MRTAKDMRVLVVVNLNGSAGRDILSGFLSYKPRCGLWSITIATDINTIAELESFDGFIVSHPEPAVNALVEEHVCASRTSVAAFCAHSPKSARTRISSIFDDNIGISRLAYDHFASLGSFRSYAYVEPAGFVRQPPWQRERLNAFAALLEREGRRLSVCPALPDRTDDWRSLGYFLKALPKPAAIYCASDLRARTVIDAAHEQRLQIPEQIAILGVDNDELICEHTHPTLSSVRANHVKIGTTLAYELDRLLSGHARNVKSRIIPVAPIEVVTRDSTGHVAPAASRIIDRALDYITENASGSLRVSDVAIHLGISQRLLEKRFASYHTTSAAAAIRQAWIRKATALLKRSHSPVTEIAHRLGFSSAKSFHAIFTRETGHAPGALRPKR